MSKLNPSIDPKYFIAIIPPSPIYDEVYQLKNYFKDTYQSKGALKSPPHITLHMPFLWKEKRETELIKKLESFGEISSPFQLELKGFGSFEPRVIFVNVLLSSPLTSLQYSLTRFCKTELNLLNAQYKDRPFHPHVTIAFRDLKKDQFKKAWKEFESKAFDKTFLCESFSLLRHDGKQWNPIKHFSLLNERDISNLV